MVEPISATILIIGAVTAVMAGTGTAAAVKPDSKITKVAEAIPVTGYVAAAVHRVKGDKDRAKRAAAKCTNSTAGVALTAGAIASAPVWAPMLAAAAPAGAVAAATATVASAAAATGGAVSAATMTTIAIGAGGGMVGGAAGGAVGVFSESKISQTIEDEEIKSQCKQGTAKDYFKAVALGSVKGAMGGAADGVGDALCALDSTTFAADAANMVGDTVGDVAGDVAGDAVGDAVGNAVENAVEGAVEDAIENAVEDAAENAAGDAGVMDKFVDGVGDDWKETVTEECDKLKDEIEEKQQKKLFSRMWGKGKSKDSLWEYDTGKKDKIRIMTSKGQQYICCGNFGAINFCDGKDSIFGTVFESIPHETDNTKVALKSDGNGYYLALDMLGLTVSATVDEYYFRVVSHGNEKYSFVSDNGQYLYFESVSDTYEIGAKSKENIKLSEVKFFVSNKLYVV